MAETRRLAYLQAMGIEVWKIRGGPTASPSYDRFSPAIDGAPEIRTNEASTRSPSTPGVSNANASIVPSAASQAVLTEDSRATPPATARSPGNPVSVWDGAAAEPSHPSRPEPPSERRTDDRPPDASRPTLLSLAARASTCTQCVLHERRQNSVFGDGFEDADWMFIGEAPGAEEDRQGLPFVGPAGQLLNAMLAAIGIAREEVYIANLVKCRPPQNRDPRPEELVACQDYLHGQLASIRPKVIVALGRFAAQSLTGSMESLGRLRGQTHQYEATSTPVVATYHPAYLLRSPAQKGKAWRDLLRAKSIVSVGD